MGARVALVEREFLGGDCLNVGCVPSKALIRASRAAAEVRDAHDYGVEDAHEKGVRTLLPERPEGCVEKGPDPFSRVNFAAVKSMCEKSVGTYVSWTDWLQALDGEWVRPWLERKGLPALHLASATTPLSAVSWHLPS